VVGGTLTLTGDLNTYSGVTTIGSGATLAAGVADAFSANSAVTDDGKLDLGSADQTIYALNGTSTGQVGSFSGTGPTTATLTVSDGGSFAGEIVDGSVADVTTALTLTAGTLTLTGDLNTIAASPRSAAGPRWRPVLPTPSAPTAR